LLRGYAIFDYFRSYNGKLFRINDYLNRFENSSKKMHLKIPVNRKALVKVIEKLLEKNKAYGKDIGIRLLLTGGYSPDGYAISKPNFFILPEALPVYPSRHFTKGISLNLFEHPRELPLVKTTNYLTAANLAKLRKKLKVQDTLYHHRGRILECTRNNFFLFHGDTLVTAEKNVLLGISRKVNLEIAEKIFKIELREVLLEELDTCTEAFISGSTRGVCPVVMIDGKVIGNGLVGENTKVLMKKFSDAVNL